MGIIDTLRDWQERHRRFVKRVHAFRIPLSPAGQRVAQVVYFSIPVIGGYFIMDWATSKAREEIQFDDSGSSGQRANEEQRRVLGNMGMAPAGSGARAGAQQQEGIRAQNEAMQKYLASLRK